jgi:hypothetical protein
VQLWASEGTLDTWGNPVGCELFGTWTVAVSSSGAAGTLTSSALFVEGTGRDSDGGDGLGAQIFHWGVQVDHDLEGEITPQDYDGARAALARFAQAHTLGEQALIFLPTDNDPGNPGAIPDDLWAIPDACIPA